MIVRAPGKLVLSGAYAVLEGAPAVVAAVDRYAYADARIAATWVTPEVRAALGDRAPSFDASELRGGPHKLGLGSSAAILVASLLADALEAEDAPDWNRLRDAVFATALQAHRAAQGGGSGLDVAASCYGGVLVYRLASDGPVIARGSLPSGLVVQAWDTGTPASTAELLKRVRAFSGSCPAAFREHMSAQSAAATLAADALQDGNVRAWLQGVVAQHEALLELGRASGAPIVTEGMAQLHRLAHSNNAAVLPSGAGGGDVFLYYGTSGPTAAWLQAAEDLGYRTVALTLGAEGASAVAAPSVSAATARS